MVLDSLPADIRQAGGSFMSDVLLLEPPGRPRGMFISKEHLDNLRSADLPLVSVPQPLVITVSVALRSAVVRSCSEALDLANIAVNESVLLSLFLLSERALGSESTWKWYIDTLPARGDGALFFEPEEIRLLELTPLGRAAESKQRQMHRQYGCCFETLEEWRKQCAIDTPPSFEDYKWANFIVLSRSISLESFADADDGNTSYFSGCDRALVPALDMFNHCSTPSARWSVGPDGSIQALLCHNTTNADLDVEVHGHWYTEMCFSYGDKSNTEWVYEHGFIPKNNTHDSWPYFVDLAGSPELVSIKQMWIHELELSPRIMLRQPDSEGIPASTTNNTAYFLREMMVTLCLEALDDSSDLCKAAVGAVAPSFPYIQVHGHDLIDDDDKLLAVRGLPELATDTCLSKLRASAHAMAANAELLRLSDPASVILGYLISECKLLRQIIHVITNNMPRDTDRL